MLAKASGKVVLQVSASSTSIAGLHDIEVCLETHFFISSASSMAGRSPAQHVSQEVHAPLKITSRASFGWHGSKALHLV